MSPTFEVDYLGNGSFQTTQLNLLIKRSIEPIQNSDAQLSARGQHHRSREEFERDIKSTTNIILLSSLHKSSVVKKDAEDFHLFPQYFQRALAYERVGLIELAINDYNTVLSIYPDYAAAHFNRAGLYNVQGQTELALKGIDRAIKLDPANLIFRENKSMLLRQQGQYMEAIEETMICRAVQIQPSLSKELVNGNKLRIPDSNQLILGLQKNLPLDEVILAMEWRKKRLILNSLIDIDNENDDNEDKDKVKDNGGVKKPVTPLLSMSKSTELLEVHNDNEVIDFLTSVKFFSRYASDRQFISEFASKLDMRKLKKDEVVFRNEDPGRSFFIVLTGEVALIDDKIFCSVGRSKIINDTNNKSIQKCTRGNVFGEESVNDTVAANRKRIERSLNAICTQPTTLLVMNAESYYSVADSHDVSLRIEMKNAIMNCKLFTCFEESKIDYLVSVAKLKYFDIGSKVVTRGELVKDLCIIRSGLVNLTKDIPKPLLHMAPPTSTPAHKLHSISMNSNNNNNSNTSPSSMYSISSAFHLDTEGKFNHNINNTSNKNNRNNSSHKYSSSMKTTPGTGTGSRRKDSIGEVSLCSGVGVAASNINGIGSPGLWVIEKSWREHSEDDYIENPQKSKVGFVRSTRQSIGRQSQSAKVNMGMNQDDATNPIRFISRAQQSISKLLNSSFDPAAVGRRTSGGSMGSRENTSNSSDVWSSSVGMLNRGQILGELCVLNPKIFSSISGIAYTKVELFTIDGEELINQGIRFEPNSMNMLNQSFNLYNPSAEKIAYYFKSKCAWEKEKKKIVDGIIKHNPRMQAMCNRNKLT